jgi:hypothetical protein
MDFKKTPQGLDSWMRLRRRDASRRSESAGRPGRQELGLEPEHEPRTCQQASIREESKITGHNRRNSFTGKSETFLFLERLATVAKRRPVTASKRVFESQSPKLNLARPVSSNSTITVGAARIHS